jgi:predicted alpha/beta-hydrolase family hydrolase
VSRIVEAVTRGGVARAHLERPPRCRGLALLGHGAGGDSRSAVLVLAQQVLVAAGWAAARTEAPYVVAARRAPDPAATLDEAQLALLAVLRRERGLGALPVLLGGKSSGARVACRISGSAGALGVVALGFPLHPPGRPEKSRADELAGASCPVLVLQGTRDTFGTPGEVRVATRDRGDIEVVEIAGGNHSFVPLRSSGRTVSDALSDVAAELRRWLAELRRA